MPLFMELIPKSALSSKSIRVSEVFSMIRNSLIIPNSRFGEEVLSYRISPYFSCRLSAEIFSENVC
jgi:hypothetical protein